jgi:hypothetical protein
MVVDVNRELLPNLALRVAVKVLARAPPVATLELSRRDPAPVRASIDTCLSPRPGHAPPPQGATIIMSFQCHTQVIYPFGVEDEIRITLRIPASLHAALLERARRDLRSLNGEIVYLLQRASSEPDSGQIPDGQPPINRQTDR